jgi:segregation and condensation protein B
VAHSLVPALEALLFSTPEPLNLAAFKRVFGEEVGGETIQAALELLKEQSREPGRGVMLVEVALGWQYLTREEYFPFVEKIAKTQREERITAAGIETLSIVAYKQPMTRADVDAIRGAASGNHIRLLMDRGLIKVSGRAESPGAPFLYGTTKQFLKHFGLRSLEDLPDPRDLGRVLSDQMASS